MRAAARAATLRADLNIEAEEGGSRAIVQGAAARRADQPRRSASPVSAMWAWRTTMSRSVTMPSNVRS